MASPLCSAEAVQPSVQQPNLMPCPTPCPPYRPAVRPQHTLPPQSRRAGDPICHPPVARTRPYALVFLHQTRERRPLHHPHSRTHHPVIRIAAQCHAEVTREVSRHENNQRAKPCRSYRGVSRRETMDPLCTFQLQNTQKKYLQSYTGVSIKPDALPTPQSLPPNPPPTCLSRQRPPATDLDTPTPRPYNAPQDTPAVFCGGWPPCSVCVRTTASPA